MHEYWRGRALPGAGLRVGRARVGAIADRPLQGALRRQEGRAAAAGLAPSPHPRYNCPQVTIRFGASTYVIGAPGKQAVGNDVRYQASIGKLARECIKSGGEITAHIGIQGRVIAGPAGAPPTVEIPLRVAVVQGGVGEKVIATKAYTTTVTMSQDESVPFTFVAEDLVYPAPVGRAGDSYIFYVGFDPQLVSTEKPKPAKKKK